MAPEAARRFRLRRGAAEIVIVAAFLAFLAWAAARQWSTVGSAIGQLSVPTLALSAAAALTGIWCSLLSWRAIVTDISGPVPLTGAMRVFFVGQAGKYVPGKVWPILAQIKLGRDYLVPGRASAAAALIFMVIVLGSGLLVAVCTLPVLGTNALGSYWWALTVLPLAAVTLWPPVLNRVLARILRLARREPMPQPLSMVGIGRAVGWALVMWLCYGVHLWVLLSTLDPDAPHLLLRSTGAFAAAWAIGFLLMVTPAGVGPRELALVVLLGSTVTQPAALVAALVSRLLMTVGDLAWAVLAIAVARRRHMAIEKVAGGGNTP